MKTIYVTITWGQPLQNKLIFFKILMIDIFGNYEPISTKFSEISVLSGE